MKEAPEILAALRAVQESASFTNLLLIALVVLVASLLVVNIIGLARSQEASRNMADRLAPGQSALIKPVASQAPSETAVACWFCGTNRAGAEYQGKPICNSCSVTV